MKYHVLCAQAVHAVLGSCCRLIEVACTSICCRRSAPHNSVLAVVHSPCVLRTIPSVGLAPAFVHLCFCVLHFNAITLLPHQHLDVACRQWDAEYAYCC